MVGTIYKQVDPRAYTNTLPEFAQKLASIPLAYQPGTRWLYSHSADVQAYLVQKLSGVPIDKFLQLHIFKPLGMSTARYVILPTDPDRGNLAAMYTRNDDGTFTRQTDEDASSSTARTGRSNWRLRSGGRPSTTT